MTMKRTYKYRIYPTKAQSAALERQLRLCRDIYNIALDQRRNSWRYCKESVSYRSQANELPGLKARHPELKEVHSQVLQDVLRRLDKAFGAYKERELREAGTVGEVR